MSRTRSIAHDLARVFDSATVPIYVVDDWRQIVYCNPACAAWTGMTVGSLVGQQCAYRTPSEPPTGSAVAAELCPPPKAFSGQPQTAVIGCTRPDGEEVFRRAQFWPLAIGDDGCAPVLAILDQHDCSPPQAGADDHAPPADAELHEQVRRFRRHMAGRFRADSLIGSSPAIVKARAQLELAARTEANVVIVGPAGSGKDHAAKAIHYGGHSDRLLVPLACAVQETNQLRATLRGLRQKTAAVKQSPGTLVLSDVDCLAPEAQEELVELIRSGALHPRIVATTVRPLEELVGERKFSEVLACLLATLTIELPPLAARAGDIPQLAQLFLEEANGSGLKQVAGFTSDALDRLVAYSWPGNVDELAAMVREAHETAGGAEIVSRDLPARIQFAADAQSRPTRVDDAIVLEEFLARVEKELIARAMRRARGNKSKAAKLLGLSRPRLYRRLVQLGLEQPDEPGDGTKVSDVPA